MNPEVIKDGCRLIEDGMRKLNSGPLSYYLKNLVGCYELLLSRFAPFHVGDRVILTRTPDIGPESGWHSSKHFLVKGAHGTVMSVECDGTDFSASVMFDDESWLPNQDFAHCGAKKGVPVPTAEKDRHTYHFRESWLVKSN